MQSPKHAKNDDDFDSDPFGAGSTPSPAELRPHLPGRIRTLLEHLDRGLLERQTLVRLTLLALLAGQHVLLLGSPGTGKSLLARAVCTCFRDGRYFEYLLTRFTHPDELFGPVSIPGLKNEDYRRLTEGYLPQAHVAFLDEIFKSSSAILNALLTLVNERLFHHGRHRDPVPLLGLIGASNEPPDPEGGLGALFDRFLVRLTVPPLVEPHHFLSVCLGELESVNPPESERLTLLEVEILRSDAAAVAVPDALREALLEVRTRLQAEHIEASDRRWRAAVDLLRMAAASEGRTTLRRTDLLLLEHCFGDGSTDQAVLRQTIRRVGVSGAHEAPSLEAAASAYRSLLEPAEGSLLTLHQQQLARLDALATALATVDTQLTGEHLERLQCFQDSLWLVDLPPECIAPAVTARRRLEALTGAVSAYRAQLAAFDFAAQALERLRVQDARSRYGYGRVRPVCWLVPRHADPGHAEAGPDGGWSAPEDWQPLDAQGVLQDPRLSSDEIRQRLETFLQSHRSGVAPRPWSDLVCALPLDAPTLDTLLHSDRREEALEALLLASFQRLEAARQGLEASLQAARDAQQLAHREQSPLQRAFSTLQHPERLERPLGWDETLRPPEQEEVRRALVGLLKRLEALQVPRLPLPPPLETLPGWILLPAPDTPEPGRSP